MNKYIQKQSKNRTISIYSMVILITFLLFSCIKIERGEEMEVAAIEKIPGFVYNVVAETAKKTSIIESITIGGDVQAKNAVSITPDTGGTLSRILVYEGEKVRRNQVIAFVDPSKAGKSFKESPVRTPIAGIVSSLPTKKGNSISAQQIIARVADDSEIELKIAIPEKYVGKVSADTKGYLTVIALPDESFEMKVKTLSPILSSSTHTMPATMVFTNQDDRIKSGMYGDLRLVLEEKKDTFVVQRDTILVRIINNESVKGIYLVQDDEVGTKQAHFTEVVLGIEDDNNMIEIVSGVKEGDIIIIQGQTALSEGNEVEIFTLDGKVLISIEDKIKALQETQNREKSKFKRSNTSNTSDARKRGR